MANVLLTTRCNLSCPYCFAQEKLSGGRSMVMSMEDVRTVIDFLKRSNHPILRAMGGEPTLHPRFLAIAELALQEQMRVDLLSNATWPESYSDFFLSVSPGRINFLLNIDHPDRYAPKLWERIQRNLEAISGRGNITFSFNLFETEPQADYIFELAERYHVDKLRMSFALPVVDADNTFLKLKDYWRMPPFIMEFVNRAEAIGATVRLDNAVPLCIFSFEQAGELLMKGVLNFEHNARCDPIVDIGPDLSVWCCFCLSSLWNRRLEDFDNLGQIVDYYRRAMGLYQGRLYPMEECYDCPYRELWNCQGGCLTFAVWKHGKLSLEQPPAHAECDVWKPGHHLALADGVRIVPYTIPQESKGVYNETTGLELELDASFQPLLDLLHGQYSAREVIDRFVDGESGPDEGPVGALASRALRQAADALLLRMLHAGFLEQRRVGELRR
jgi:MoaA/NifB/PqqE/SkfB family radical SAM enzyme